MISWYPGTIWAVYLLFPLLSCVTGKWVEGRVDTKENWAFLARFCFLSLEGEFEYLIEFDKDMGTPNLLLYYDDDSQWPAVYHSTKTCKEREVVLNRAGQNQIIKLSHWYPDTEYSGCVITKENKELPASMSTTTIKPTTQKTTTTTQRNTNNSNTTLPPQEPSYYDKFLKTTTPRPKSTIVDANSTTWFEVLPEDLNSTTTGIPDEELWESVDGLNGSQFEKLNDVELLFTKQAKVGHKIKRATSELYDRFRRRRLNSEPSHEYQSSVREKKERLIISCHNSRRFRSARERWWFIAISNCDNDKGLDVRYKFLMTNGPSGDFWHHHFSADEFYVLPVLLAYTLAYVVVIVAVIMCSVELKSRRLLHSTYKQYLGSVLVQGVGLSLQAIATAKYAASGRGPPAAKLIGQFLCGLSEMLFLLVLVLMAKGYSITRGRLKLGFTVKLTVFMCCYCVAYFALFAYQDKAFDPGEVLYLYESPPGYGLIVLRILAWCMFAYATFFTVRKFPEKNMFYCPFSICGTVWFFAGPLFILTANSYIDKWVRESVVTAVLLFISFSGHIMFLLLTLPVFANKNFPYHVRTTQIGMMEVTGNGAIDNFGHNAYHPSNGAGQTVIIPLTRRTEELIGNMYNQYMATAPSEDDPPKLNGLPKRIDHLTPQDSTETNTSDDIKPCLSRNDREHTQQPVFTVENQMARIKEQPISSNDSVMNGVDAMEAVSKVQVASPTGSGNDTSRSLPLVRSRRNILDPIKRDDIPQWSLAKGPTVIAMVKKTKESDKDDEAPESPKYSLPTLTNSKKVPCVRNGLPSSGEISTIHEGHVQTFSNGVSKATIDLFSVTGNGAIDNFGHNAYHPSNGAGQTVIIPLTRRTEELIGNMYNQYMATAPSEDDPLKLNGLPKRIDHLTPQDSTETNTSDDIKPCLSRNDREHTQQPVFTVENQMARIKEQPISSNDSVMNGVDAMEADSKVNVASPTGSGNDTSRSLPLVRSRRNILDPIKRDDIPQWSLAKGPTVIAMVKKTKESDKDDEAPESPKYSLPTLTNSKKVPCVRNGLPSSGEISTIHEGHVQTFSNGVSKATIDLFSVGSKKI